MAEVRKLGANDLQIGEGSVTSPGGKSVVEIDAAKIPVAYGTANDAVTGYSDVAFSIDDALTAIADVRASGAVGDGSTNDTTAIQAAIDSGVSTIIVPKSLTYRVDGTLSIGSNITLIVDGTISRVSAAATTTPLINFVGKYSTVRGNGTISTAKTSPNGLILFGTDTPNGGSMSDDVEWNKVVDITISGVKTAGNKGIVFQCNAAYGGAKVCYMNWVRNVTFQHLGTGLYVGAASNANMGNGLYFWDIATYSIHFDGEAGSAPNNNISDWTIQQVFTHSSTNVVSLYLRNASYNSFINMHGEPGTGSSMYDIDADSDNNLIFGIDNHANASTDAGTRTTKILGAGSRFSAYLSATASNVTGDGTAYTILPDTEIFDINSRYDTGAGAFTAAEVGQYRFSGAVYLTGLGAGHTTVVVNLVTSNRTYVVHTEVISSQDKTTVCVPFSTLADMDFGDIAYMQVQVSGSTKTVNVYGGAGQYTYFQGEHVR